MYLVAGGAPSNQGPTLIDSAVFCRVPSPTFLSIPLIIISNLPHRRPFLSIPLVLHSQCDQTVLATLSPAQTAGQSHPIPSSSPDPSLKGSGGAVKRLVYIPPALSLSSPQDQENNQESRKKKKKKERIKLGHPLTSPDPHDQLS